MFRMTHPGSKNNIRERNLKLLRQSFGSIFLSGWPSTTGKMRSDFVIIFPVSIVIRGFTSGLFLFFRITFNVQVYFRSILIGVLFQDHFIPEMDHVPVVNCSFGYTLDDCFSGLNLSQSGKFFSQGSLNSLRLKSFNITEIISGLILLKLSLYGSFLSTF